MDSATTETAAEKAYERSPLGRRQFLGALGGIAAGAALVATQAGASGDKGVVDGILNGNGGTAPLAPGMAMGVVTPDKLGIQLWTCLAEYVADAPETLSLVSQLGYRFVEYAFGYGSVKSAKAYRKALDDTGLWVLGGHDQSPYPYDDKKWKTFVEASLEIGAVHLGTNSGYPTTYSECMRYVEAIHKAHAVARSMGHHGYLYNHLEAAGWVRCSDKPELYAVEVLMQHTTTDMWNPELDSAHSLAPLGSVRAVTNMMRKYPNRFTLLHMKDGIAPVYQPDGSFVASPFNGTPFGLGDFGRPDLDDPENRPHAGFQDLLTTVAETTDWKRVFLLAESDGSQATCVDYAIPAYTGLKGLKFPYHPRSRAKKSTQPKAK